MRILINALGARLGGAVRHLRPFLDALVKLEPRWNLHVYIPAGRGDFVAGLPVTVVEVRGTGTVSRLSWDLRRFAREAQTMGADCVVSVTNFGPIGLRMPSILFQRNSYYFDQQWVRCLGFKERVGVAARRRLAFWEMSAASYVVTPTTAMADFIRAWKGAPTEVQYVTVAHAIDTDVFPFRPRPLESLDGAQLVVMSHPGPHKGVDTAIRLVDELRRRNTAVTLRLTIAKDDAGPYRAHVQRWVHLTSQLGLDNEVIFGGPTPDAAALYRSADVIVIPSLTESFGFPLIEAMASGVPVLASALPCPMEIGGSAAAWFTPGDHHEAADKLEELARVPREQAFKQLESARRSVERMTWNRNAEAVADLIRRCVVNWPTPGAKHRTVTSRSGHSADSPAQLRDPQQGSHDQG